MLDGVHERIFQKNSLPLNLCNLERVKTPLLLTAEIYDFLISEGYPDSYKRNFDNASTHAIPEGWEMKIFFHDFFVEYAPDCK